MRDRPINLRDWQVKAALDGRLSALVVALPKVPRFSDEFERQWCCNAIPHSGGQPGEWGWWNGPWHGQSLYHTQTLPLIVGDRYWAREAWERYFGDSTPVYKADYPGGLDLPPQRRWRSSMHMPRHLSRITIIPTSVRVCRVQDVTQDEARAAGAKPWTGALQSWRADFYRLWIDQHGPDAWERNPWVCIARVTTHALNIDSMGGEG
jgi:hypothetical protein